MRGRLPVATGFLSVRGCSGQSFLLGVPGTAAGWSRACTPWSHCTSWPAGAGHSRGGSWPLVMSGFSSVRTAAGNGDIFPLWLLSCLHRPSAIKYHSGIQGHTDAWDPRRTEDVLKATKTAHCCPWTEHRLKRRTYSTVLVYLYRTFRYNSFLLKLVSEEK